MPFQRPGALWTKDHRCPECCLQIPQRQDYILHIGGHHRAVEQFLPAKRASDCFPSYCFLHNLAGIVFHPPVIFHHERRASTAPSHPAPQPRKHKKLSLSTSWSVRSNKSSFTRFLFRLFIIGRTWNHVMAQHSGLSQDDAQSAQQHCSRILSVT